ncbi:DUF4249 family protein [Pedobacter sp. KBW06]|uniref:DUF4249 family protein n=1 Tax=Pedobacter sp. KBW06 TaxID=2153359 RepID=UPI0013158956|nr:DUF4249 family protein [Pedobacter sp. KBW06]
MWVTRIHFKTPVLLLGFSALLSGCEETIAPKFPDESKIAVTAELIADQPPVLHIVELNSIGYAGSAKPIADAEVAIQDLQTKERYTFSAQGNGYWKNEGFQAKSGKTYQLNVKTKNQEVKAVSTVPAPLNTSAERSDNSQTTISLNLPVANFSPLIITLESRSYRMEGTSVVYLGDWENTGMICKDPATDNIRYGELPAPWLKLFIPAETTAKTLTFNPENQTGMRKYRLHVKAAEPGYYKYVYDYEYLKNNNSSGYFSYIALQSNVIKGLGIFAGVYEKVIEL